jgi:hypothetical protein
MLMKYWQAAGRYRGRVYRGSSVAENWWVPRGASGGQKQQWEQYEYAKHGLA